MKAVYGVSDAARYLGVSKSKLATWSERTGVGQRSDAGGYTYSDDDLKALELIRSLREEDRSFDTIVRRIRPFDDETASLTLAAAPEPATERPLVVPDSSSLVGEITAAVTAAIQADLRMAENYARAMQRLCDLQWEVRQLHDERSLLVARHQEEREALTAEILRLQTDLAAEAARPWWRKLLGWA